ERHHRFGVGHLRNQRSNIVGNPGALLRWIKIAKPGLEQSPVDERRETAEHQLDEGSRWGWIDRPQVVSQPLCRGDVVGSNPGKLFRYRVDVPLQSFFWETWAFAAQETDPTAWINPLHVVRFLRPIPKLRCTDVPRMLRPAVPAIRPAHRWIHLMPV